MISVLRKSELAVGSRDGDSGGEAPGCLSRMSSATPSL